MAYDYRFECYLFGDSSIGKSCLLSRLCEKDFRSDILATMGVDLKSGLVNVNGKSVQLYIVDTTGAERFRPVSASFYRRADAAFLVYDVTQRVTFENIRNWLRDLQKVHNPDVSIILIGNKCDLDNRREVLRAEAETFASEHGFKFMETSARTGMNVQLAFMTAAEEVMKKIQEMDKDPRFKIMDPVCGPTKRYARLAGTLLNGAHRK